MRRDVVTVSAPASLSNLGPGFDCLGVAISNFGDRIRARRQPGPEVTWEWHRSSVWSAPVRSEDNTAVVAARSMLRRLDIATGVHLEISKQGRAGSGLGSSAASAVAAALAVAALEGRELEKDVIREAALDGEQAASAARHGDNVLPSLYGGFVLAQSDRLEFSRRIDCPTRLHLAIILPDIDVLTREARGLLPREIPLDAAVRHASLLGMLVNAICCGNASDIGHLVMCDEIVEPKRAVLVTAYQDIRSSAVHAGAHGVALSGSGPAMFAVCPTSESASEVTRAMQHACAHRGMESIARTSSVDTSGARIDTETGQGGDWPW